jgi:tRNA-Thr(GGU) m(6)t(6)A37 methyltransferase TsaA
MELGIRPIGYVKTSVKKETDENWGKIISEIIIDRRYAKGLKGLDNFSHIIIVFYMHKASFDIRSHLLRKPQGKQDMPFLGIFAQRAKHRPNPIGITSVELISVNDNIIQVKGLDAIDETPIIDIKPYFPIFDSKTNVRTPDWVERLMKNYF